MPDDVIYSCVVGSHAYGLAGPGSDTDRRGVYVAPTAAFWGFDKPPPHRDGPRPEEFSWELERCLALALQANPTVLEVLWSPLVETVTEVGHELLAVRDALLSRRVADTYGRYAADQFDRLSAVRARTGEIKWKQAMHMLRLLICGAHLLRTGEVRLDVREHRTELLAVRAGEVSFDAVTDRARELRTDLDTAAAGTALPARPDRDRVQELLVSVRRRAMPG